MFNKSVLVTINAPWIFDNIRQQINSTEAMNFKEINDLYQRINQFIETSPWSQIFEHSFNDFLESCCNSKEEHLEKLALQAAIEINEPMHEILSLIFNESLMLMQHKFGKSVVDDYIDHSSQKESQETLGYLQKLTRSKIQICEIIDIQEDNIIVDVVCTGESISFHTEDNLFSDLEEGMWVAVGLNEGKSRKIGLSILPLDPPEVEGDVKPREYWKMVSSEIEEGYEINYKERENIGHINSLEHFKTCCILTIWLNQVMPDLDVEFDLEDEGVDIISDLLDKGEIIGLQYKIIDKEVDIKQMISNDFPDMFGFGHHLLMDDGDHLGAIRIKNKYVEFNVLEEKHVHRVRDLVSLSYAGILSDKPVKTYQSTRKAFEGFMDRMINMIDPSEFK